MRATTTDEIMAAWHRAGAREAAGCLDLEVLTVQPGENYRTAVAELRAQEPDHVVRGILSYSRYDHYLAD